MASSKTLGTIAISVGASVAAGVLLEHYRRHLREKDAKTALVRAEGSRAVLAGEIVRQGDTLLLPPGTYWADRVMSASAWLEIAESLGMGAADEAAAALAAKLEAWAKSQGGRLTYTWNPPGILAALYGDDGVFFATVELPNGGTWTKQQAQERKMLWTRWRGRGLPSVEDTAQAPRVQSWQEALLEYGEDIKGAALTPVSWVAGAAALGVVGFLLIQARKD